MSKRKALGKGMKPIIPQQTKKKQKKDFSKRVIIPLIVIMIVGYTAISLLLQFKTSTEVSSTLTTSWFVFWTVEIIAITGIKVSKVRQTNDTETEETIEIEEE